MYYTPIPPVSSSSAPGSTGDSNERMSSSAALISSEMEALGTVQSSLIGRTLTSRFSKTRYYSAKESQSKKLQRHPQGWDLTVELYVVASWLVLPLQHTGTCSFICWGSAIGELNDNQLHSRVITHNVQESEEFFLPLTLRSLVKEKRVKRQNSADVVEMCWQQMVSGIGTGTQ